ncbi:MAG: hypothetical protein MRY83_11635 [Flavobacteriales bacterium]|nr:hypothetical protein [Flavobacteriales bacterium]
MKISYILLQDIGRWTDGWIVYSIYAIMVIAIVAFVYYKWKKGKRTSVEISNYGKQVMKIIMIFNRKKGNHTVPF